MKKITLFVLLTLPNILLAQTVKTIYDFKVTSIDGNEISLDQYRGKKILIVNTASKCGFTPQYAELEELYQEFKDKNFVILGFPANNFFKQEPGTNSEIKEFCTRNYGVSFPMMSKISVKGKDIDPLFQYLTSKAENGYFDGEVSWNFQKFLIDENGKLVKVVSPRKKPKSSEVMEWITQNKL